MTFIVFKVQCVTNWECEEFLVVPHNETFCLPATIELVMDVKDVDYV